MTPDIPLQAEKKTAQSQHFEKHITVRSTGQNALQILAEQTMLSKQKLKQAMSNGAVWLESAIGIHRLRRAKKTLNTNDVLHLYYDETIQNTKPAAATLIADEGEYSIWNKPSGMYSQGSKWGDHCTIYRWAETHLQPQRPAFPVHRLDRAANGLIILAHSKTMARTFSKMFQQREIVKRYRVTVEGEPEFDLPFTIDTDIDDKPALSTIIAIDHPSDSRQNRMRLDIEIETGRKHQIRKHLSALGFPVVGDRLYGSSQKGSPPGDENLQLQSNYLQFTCPVTNMTKTCHLDFHSND
jgi:tRNA pseudouridine32 synthase / 23S rRNA pseudouridine746 synthase